MAQPLQAAHQAKDSQSMFSLSPHAPNTRNEYAVLRYRKIIILKAAPVDPRWQHL